MFAFKKIEKIKMIAATLNAVLITKFFLSITAFSISFESSEITIKPLFSPFKVKEDKLTTTKLFLIFFEKVKTLSDPNMLKLSLIILLSKFSSCRVVRSGVSGILSVVNFLS